MFKSKQINILNNSYRERMLNYFNPYYFNLDNKNNLYNDGINMQSIRHSNRQKKK